MDVKTAYLNADIDYEIYMKQPEGFNVQSDDNKQLVCKLNKSLYGLKQSGNLWNNLLHDFLIQMAFKQSMVDHCVYTKFKDKNKVIIIIFVDDIIIAANNDFVMKDIKAMLCNKFRMKDLNVLNYFLGIEFECHDDSISMNQTNYFNKILEKFNMSDCKTKSGPCELSLNTDMINVNSESLSNESHRVYRGIVGSLIYAMIGTRPDLCFIVAKLSQYLSSPTEYHLKLAKQVLRYIKGTLNYKLIFKKSNELELMGYCDSDYGGSDDRCSISGYCFQLNKNGPLISWKSKKQNNVALSSCEAEYIALTSAIQEANFLRQLFADMQGSDKKQLMINVDNQAAISLAKNPVYHQRSKHIDIKYHYIRSEVKNNKVLLKYVPSELNLADIFTKPVSSSKLNKFSYLVKD